MDKNINNRIEKLEFNKRLADKERMTLDEYYDAPDHIQDDVMSGWYGEGEIQSDKPHSDEVKAWLKVHRSGGAGLS